VKASIEAWQSGRKPSRADENSGRGNLSAGKGKGFFSKAEEKISREKDFPGLFFLPPCLGKDFSGLKNEFSGFGKDFSGKADDENGVDEGRVSCSIARAACSQLPIYRAAP